VTGTSASSTPTTTYDWHAESVESALARLGSTPLGITSDEAARRLLEHGPNELERPQPVSPFRLVLAQFRNVLIVILLLATGISALLGHEIEAIAIAVIVAFSVVLGFVQEYRAERAIEALREMASPTANALRDRRECRVPARELVQGDVVLLRSGDRVPADLRLLESFNLQVEEAALTGESVPVEKKLDPVERGAALADRRNLAFAATTVTYGRGRGLVVATGLDTELGGIARWIGAIDTAPTPLQESLDRMGKSLARAGVGVVAVIVVIGVLRGRALLDMLVLGIALAVAVVPEALPAVVTISLAIGVRRLVKRNALIRRMQAVETLGSTSVICSDKTGTLTRDEMTVREIHCSGHRFEVTGAGYEPRGDIREAGTVIVPTDSLRRLLRAGALAADARLERDEQAGRFRVKGDPTEGALLVAAAKAGLDKEALDGEYPRVDEIPFTSETKRMTTLHASEGGVLACSKGAPEIVVASCARLLTDEGGAVLGPSTREEILQTAREMARRALRVLAVADKTGATRETAERDMTFLGLVAMMDPPRAEAQSAVETCTRAGIKPVMITGDHPITAQAVASELGILRTGRVVTGTDLDDIDDAALESEIEGIDVFARVSPAHKLRVVTALQRSGHVVAMTGDGVNDAPALKKADIGIAMGLTGTDVSREAADMTLTDDNFASIVAAVEEGRGIFGNITKYLSYLLSSNVGEIGLMAVASLAGWPLPLSAVQILYVNLATDGLPALALSVDPPEPDLMSRPPRDRRSRIFSTPIVVLMLVGGLWSASVNLAMFAFTLRSGASRERAMTMTFVTLILIQFFKAYNFRSDRHSVLRRPFANRWLNLAILWEVALLALVIHLPVLQRPFGTLSLTFEDWALALGSAFTVGPVLELTKWSVRRGWLGSKE
jgi:P-type Ca2+ transporter type 2C